MFSVGDLVDGRDSDQKDGTIVDIFRLPGIFFPFIGVQWPNEGGSKYYTEDNLIPSHTIDPVRTILGFPPKSEERTFATGLLEVIEITDLDETQLQILRQQLKNLLQSKACECGKDTHGFANHSDWCPKY